MKSFCFFALQVSQVYLFFPSSEAVAAITVRLDHLCGSKSAFMPVCSQVDSFQ